MKILALDIGTKRIGVAKANTLISVAMPVKVINRETEEKDLKEIEDILTEYQIDKILLGLPINLNGKEEHFAKYVRKFGDILKKKFNKEIIYWDERLSSVSAERALNEGRIYGKKRKNKVDKIAATIFLQNYLDYLQRNK
jgi:putative Holliday junction resolvase